MEGDRQKHVHLYSGQSIVSLLITCAIKSTSKPTQEMMLNVPFLDIFIKTIAAKSTLRLRESDKLKYNHVGGSNVLREIWKLTIFQGIDYTALQ